MAQMHYNKQSVKPAAVCLVYLLWSFAHLSVHSQPDGCCQSNADNLVSVSQMADSPRAGLFYAVFPRLTACHTVEMTVKWEFVCRFIDLVW